MDMMRVPVATILFLGSVYFLLTTFNRVDGFLSNVGAMICIAALVISFMLYSNINIVK